MTPTPADSSNAARSESLPAAATRRETGVAASGDESVDELRTTIEDRLDEVLRERIALGSFEGTYATFTAKHPASAG